VLHETKTWMSTTRFLVLTSINIRGHPSKTSYQKVTFWTPSLCPPSSVWTMVDKGWRDVHHPLPPCPRASPKRKIFCDPEVNGWAGGGSDSDTDSETQQKMHLWMSCLWPTTPPLVRGRSHGFKPPLFTGRI